MFATLLCIDPLKRQCNAISKGTLFPENDFPFALNYCMALIYKYFFNLSIFSNPLMLPLWGSMADQYQ
jgi:hypothetical protein